MKLNDRQKKRLAVILAFSFAIMLAVALPSYGINLSTTGQIFGSGAVIPVGTSNITIATQIVSAQLETSGDWAAWNTSSAPAYILQWPYFFIPAQSRLNITEPATPQERDLDVDIAMGSGFGSLSDIRVYGSTGRISDLTFQTSSNALIVNTIETSTLTVYTGSAGKPDEVTVDGIPQDEGVGWSWSSTSRLLVVVGGTAFTMTFQASVPLLEESVNPFTPTGTLPPTPLGMLQQGFVIPAIYFIYVSLIGGQWFLSIILLAVGSALYLKSEHVWVPLVVMFAMASVMNVLLPTQITVILFTFGAASIAGILFMIFKRHS